ncbi:MAG: uridine kinase [Crocinitomicaceae bacterium]
MKQFVVGITGGSGVGKTTLINLLNKSFKDQITIFSLDNYYKAKSDQDVDENGVINFDLPSALDTQQLAKDLKLLLNEKSIKQNIYHFNNPNRLAEVHHISPKQIIVVEGLFVMHYPFVKSELDLAVYISVDEKKQLERRLKRDVKERNYDKDEVLYQWHNHVIPAYKSFIEPYAKECDIIINNELDFDENLKELISIIKNNAN